MESRSAGEEPEALLRERQVPRASCASSGGVNLAGPGAVGSRGQRSSLPCGGDWRDDLRGALPVLFDVEDVENRPDLIVARLAGPEEEQTTTDYDPGGMRFVQFADDNPVYW